MFLFPSTTQSITNVFLKHLQATYAARGGGDHSMQSWRSPATSKLLRLLNPNFSYRCLPSGVAWMKACLFSAAACSIPQRRRRPPMPRRW